MSPVGSGYLRFVEDTSIPGLATRVILVQSTRSSALLGHIRWFGRWRQYTFWPRPNTTFNQSCLAEINGQIRDLMAERRG